MFMAACTCTCMYSLVGFIQYIHVHVYTCTGALLHVCVHVYNYRAGGVPDKLCIFPTGES